MSTTPSGSASRRGAAARRRAAPRQRGAAAAEDETDQVRALRAKYPTQLAMLSELFPAWSDEDLLFVLQESQGEVEVAVGRISEGHAEQFSSVKSKKTQKKEAAAAHAATVPTTTSSTATPPATVVPAPAPTVASAEGASSRRARTHERGSRGRGASTPAARGGRGGFRGVARGGSNAGVSSTMGAGVPNDTTGSMPVITTAAAFGLKTPQPTSTTSTPATSAPNAKNTTATTTKTPASKSKAAMSWAQIARPAEPKPAPAATAPTAASAAAAAPAPSAATPTSASDSVTPATETTSSEKTSSADAPAKAVSVPPPGEQETSLSEAKAAAVSAAASSGSAPIAAAAAAAASTGSRPSRSQRPPQDAAVVMPGNASSLDRLGMQFGSLNFGAPSTPTNDTPATESTTAPPTETPSSAPAGAAASTHSAMPATQPAPQPVRDYDAFKGSAFAGTGTGTGTYGLSHAAPTHDDASLYHQAGTPTGMPASSAPGYSSMYAFDSHQRISQQQPYGHSGSGVGTTLRSDDRMPASSQPATPGAPPVPDAAAGMQQQPFPNVMPYYYPYYMPNQFQHFSPAAGFGQYPLYGGQPAAAQQQQQQQQQHHHHPPQQPQQPPQPGAKAGDVTTGGASGLGSYVHHDNTSAASYDAQGFGQRLGGSSNEFKLPGASDATSNNGLPGLSFLGGASGAGAPPGMSSAGPARGGASSAAGTPGGSTPLDYRAFDASKSPAGRPAGTPGAGGPPPPPHGVPTPGAQQGTAAPMAAAQQHPAYYQQYAGFTQANAYDGYSYGRQPYWA